VAEPGSEVVGVDAVVVGELEREVLVLGAVAQEGVGVLFLFDDGESVFLVFFFSVRV
jgi:hypothetical protein